VSDQFNSCRALADAAIDLTDLHAFPAPSQQGQLVLVMSVFLSARPDALFSDAASYRFRVCPAAIPARGPRLCALVGRGFDGQGVWIAGRQTQKLLNRLALALSLSPTLPRRRRGHVLQW
jgi:hypothetical protein